MKWESRPRLLGAPNDAGLQHPLLDALPAGHLLNQGVDKSSKSSSRSQIHLLTPHVAKLAAAALAVEDSHLRSEEMPGARCQVPCARCYLQPTFFTDLKAMAASRPITLASCFLLHLARRMVVHLVRS